MAQYLVQWRYGSSIGGPWAAGEVVEIDDPEVAAAIGRDSPGVLAPVLAPDALTDVPGVGRFEAEGLRAAGILTYAQLEAADPAGLAQQLFNRGVLKLQEDAPPDFELRSVVTAWQAGARALLATAQDRMQRKGRNRRRDRAGDPGDAGPITRAHFKAVKGKKGG